MERHQIQLKRLSFRDLKMKDVDERWKAIQSFIFQPTMINIFLNVILAT